MLLTTALSRSRQRQAYQVTRCLSCQAWLAQSGTVSGIAWTRWAHTAATSQGAAIPEENIRNIGIIAHVDAGKTTTTERMYFVSGTSRHQGRVDDGNTVTDYLPMERNRGITIESAALSFQWPPPGKVPNGTTPTFINLIDTPGHQDFQYEVLRCMHVLDGAVCVIDGGKGVEAHTERVWASAQQFNVPRLIYVNKMDRDGASFKQSVLSIAGRLNVWPLVCHIPWFHGDKLVGVLDVITREGRIWTNSGIETKHSADELPKHVASALIPELETAREQLIEGLANHDEVMLETSLECLDKGTDVPAQSIMQSIRRIVSSGKANAAPVFAGASAKDVGVEPLLDAVVDYLPSPQDRPPLVVRTSKGPRALSELVASESGKVKAGKRPIKPQELMIASVFKVIRHSKHGILSFVRVYRGTLQRMAATWNTGSESKDVEKPLTIMQIAGDKAEELPDLTTGNIGALRGLKHTRTGDTLIAPWDVKNPDPVLADIEIRPAEIPPAVAFLTIDAPSLTAQQDLEQALTEVSRRDPSARWHKDVRSDRHIVSGLGSLHLEIIRTMLRGYNLNAHIGDNEVDYRESITQMLDPEYSHIEKQLGGHPGKASCTAHIEPLGDYNEDKPKSTGARLSRIGVSGIGDAEIYHANLTSDGNDIDVTLINPIIDNKFDLDAVTRALQNGVRSALASGPKRGQNLRDVHVEIIFDGRTDYYGPSATPPHYAAAANQAVRSALQKAHARGQTCLLEPVMRVDIACPENVADRIRHDISSRAGGNVIETESAAEEIDGDSRQIIDLDKVYAPPDPYDSQQSLRDAKKQLTRMVRMVVLAPLKDMLTYDQHLRSMTEGRHSMSMSLDSFMKVTAHRERVLEQESSLGRTVR